MAKKYDMRLLYSETFAEFFAKHSNDRENKELLSRMKALEVTCVPSMMRCRCSMYGYMLILVPEGGRRGRVEGVGEG